MINCAITATINTLNRIHRSIAVHNPYYIFILTKDYSKNCTTRLLLTIEHIAMFVVKCIVIRINGQVNGSINYNQRRQQ